MSLPITLISHALCPYVQRIAIALAEKGVVHERVTVDLAMKPGWFLALSPLGRTPVLKVGEAVLFESVAILEFLEETQPHRLHPADPIERARHRAWIGFASECLNDIAGFYSARDLETFEARTAALATRFHRLEEHLGSGPWFAGADFRLVDVVFGPVFRYFDVFDGIDDFGILTGRPRVCAWRARLADRPTIRKAVSADYNARLNSFLLRRGGVLADRIRSAGAA